MDNLEHFVKVTIGILLKDGLAGFLSTLVDEETGEITAIDGIPDDVDHCEALMNSIQRYGLTSKHFLFAVHSGPGVVTAGSCVDGSCHFVEIASDGADCQYSPIPKPTWWTLSAPSRH